MALSPRFEYFLYPLIVMFQAMPKVALAPLIVVWFGLGIGSKVVNAALVCFFPLMVNTIVGLRSADEDRVALLRSLAASPFQVFWMLRLPGAAPTIFAGLELAMIFALIGAIVAEFVGAESGLGMLIQSMNFSMDVAGQFSVLFILALIGLGLNACVAAVRRRGGVLGWRRPARVEGEQAMMRFLVAAAVLLAAAPSWAQSVRLGWCSRTLNSAIAPFAVATKMGWFGGMKIEPIPMNGSIDCTKNVATKEVAYAIASIEPLAILRPQGVKVVNYYTAYQGNIYGIAVPEDSPVRTIADLRGKRIGVTSMASGGVIVARALVANAGMNPDRDVRIVVAGEGAQTAALLRSKEVDALSQFDTTYALAMNAGAKLRFLDENKTVAKFPSNGLIALEETLATRRAEAVALARGYAIGTIFTIANPEAAVKIMYEVYPQVKPTGKDEATAVADDVRTIQARAPNWALAAGGVTRWGESSEANYDAYVDFLVKWGVVKEKVPASQLVTNALLDEIDRFDQGEIEAKARAWK